MKTRWQSTLFKALEVRPTFAPLVIATCAAMWYNKGMENGNVLAVQLEHFWSSSVSKTSFQAFYIGWLITNYRDTKPLYLYHHSYITTGLDFVSWVCISISLPQLHSQGSL